MCTVIYTVFNLYCKCNNVYRSANFDDYCLAYLFGHRDYSGSLGLAWTGRTSEAGGVCEQNQVSWIYLTQHTVRLFSPGGSRLQSGNPRKSLHGIKLRALCTLYTCLFSTQNFAGTDKSLNSGVVTTSSYNNDVPFSTSKLTFAHEIGHNMGAEVSSLL